MVTGSRRTRWSTPLIATALVTATLVPVVGGGTAGAVDVPTAPRTVTAVGGTKAGYMTVKWQPPANFNGSPLVNYSVATATDGGPFGPAVSNAKKLTFKAPCAGTTSCTFRVYATNSIGTSPASAPATGVWTVPGTPKVKSVTAGLGIGQMVPLGKPGQDVEGRSALRAEYSRTIVSRTRTVVVPTARTRSAAEILAHRCPAPRGSARRAARAPRALSTARGRKVSSPT